MKAQRFRFPLIAAGAVAAGAALAFALPGGTAAAVQSQSPPAHQVKLGNTATLDADGAVVFAPVSVLCGFGSYASLTLTVAENVNGDIASGTASEQVASCTGQTQRLEIAVIPTQKAFRPGVAFGQVKLQVCGSFGCQTVIDQHNVQIVKRR
jgi:hypothetical protein